MNDELQREELRLAARMLLVRPLLRSGGPQSALTASIRKPHHQRQLQQWFERNFGWNLIVDRDVVRLQKIPSMPAAHADDAPQQRVCVLYCLALAALEDCGEQTVITEIAQRVTDLSLTRPELATYDPEPRRERRALVEALRLLADHGVLVPTRGEAATEQDEAEYIHGDGDAIYDIEHRVASLLLACPVPPSRAGHPADLTREPIADTADGHNRHRRHQLMRRLVDEPVMHLDELDEDTQAYFRNQRHLLIGEITDMLGTRVEVRSEGAALVDDELTDVRFPLDRTVQFAALLLAEALAEQTAGTEEPVPDDKLAAIAETVCEKVAAKVKTIEGREVTPVNVLKTALKVLAGLRLIHLTDDGVAVRPALGRFRASIRAGSRDSSGAPPLFEGGQRDHKR